MDKDIAEMTAAIEQAFAADPICGGRFCAGTAETAARAAYAVVQARVERLEMALQALAGIKAEDGDDFSSYAPETIIRCEITAADIHNARSALADTQRRGE